MTMEIRVENKDTARTARIIELDGSRPGGVVLVSPGSSYTAHVHSTRSLFVEEVGDIDRAPPTADPMLQFFEFEHLSPALQAASKPWCSLAHHIVRTTPRNPERTVALRKLLEGKDCAVRALLWKDPG